MSLGNLFVRVRRTIGSVQLDGVLTEDHDFSMSITENPIDFGASISDHAYANPRILTMVAVITDTPLTFTGALGNIVDDVTGVFGSSTSENVTRSVTGYNAIIALANSKTFLEVQTGLLLYKNMMISRVQTIRDKKNSRISKMVISFREVIAVESELIDLPAEKLQEGDVKNQGSPSLDSGKKEPVTPSPSEENSYLKSISDWFK